mmetsp:Transcript_2376/g.3988  ORF Transcript_2376/g.3988 Transcript_2376/m.3988 type:complete len:158 (+) Transcript_2376:121-594(+)
MRAVVIVLACLGCAGQARRVKTVEQDSGSSQEVHQGSHPSKAFAQLLLASNPVAGWQTAQLPASLGHGSDFARSGRAAYAATQRAPLLNIPMAEGEAASPDAASPEKTSPPKAEAEEEENEIVSQLKKNWVLIAGLGFVVVNVVAILDPSSNYNQMR